MTKVSGILSAIEGGDEDPPTPSTRIGSSAEIVAVAGRCSLLPHELLGIVHGELDWIVMKALEKDRNRRYETPSALAADIHRYLQDEPVGACPPSSRYRLRKFVRKHRAALLAATAFGLLLIAGAAVSLAFALRATEESLKKTAALRAKEDARAEATHASAQAMDALRSLSDDVIERQMGRKTQLDSEDQAFLLRIAGYYESFAALKGEEGAERRHFQLALVEWLITVDPRRASVEAAELAGSGSLQPAECFGLACLIAKIATSFSDAGEQAPLETRSTALLELARAGGWFRDPENLARLRTEPALEPLRTHAEFAKILESAADVGSQVRPAEGSTRRDR